MKTRTVSDALGEVTIPFDALYQAQTQRAIENFPVSGIAMPTELLKSLVLLKLCAAKTHGKQNQIPLNISDAIVRASEKVLREFDRSQFPVDVFQTGSGTSTNMNVNEVLASMATKELSQLVHPNDHVNKGQSSNDVIPSALLISAEQKLRSDLLPAMAELVATISKKKDSLSAVLKTGRTHLMDAVPISMAQELGAWQFQLQESMDRFESCFVRMRQLPLGGTAVGTGLNSSDEFAEGVVSLLNENLNADFVVCENRFARIAGQETSVECAAHLKNLAVTLLKICNDLRWMSSGPVSGLCEITLPALQPGSSIMPGKVNPVIPEAVAMACVQVMGNETAITLAAQSGNFQLNVMLPVIAKNLLDSMTLLTNGCMLLAHKAIAGMQANEKQLRDQLAKNPILVTALVPIIGYDLASKIAKQSMATGEPVIDVASALTTMDRQALETLLNPSRFV